MKPQPLDLEDVHEKVFRQIKRDDVFNRDGLIKATIVVTEDEILQRLKSACEFYLKYKDKPLLLWEEEGFLLHELNITKELWDIMGKLDDKEWTINDYNDWLFKLAFKDVFEK